MTSHPPGMVVGTRAGKFVGQSFLSTRTPSKSNESLCQLEKLLVIASGKEVLVFGKKLHIDEGQNLRNFREEGGRDKWEGSV